MRFIEADGSGADARLPETARVRAGTVVVVAAREDPRSHECVTRIAIARRLAALHGYDYSGGYAPSRRYAGALYVVPAETVVGADAAWALGIRCESDLFGGVVPFAFVGTKSITHELAGDRARKPPGWSGAFARAVREVVLPGHSAFSREDAARAGRRLLEEGPVRVKPALGVGGRGQTLVRAAAELESAIGALDPVSLAVHGVAVEQHLEDCRTYSVGQVRVAKLVATYFGIQKLTTDNAGQEVYGGSDLTVARGGFDALLALDIDENARLAIQQARVYDAAAERHYFGFYASRRNYDIARGRDARGEMRCGVLEQSWRIGGASGAELAALEAFAADPALKAVRAECSEVYGEGAQPPAAATVYFSGIDPVVGCISKYTTLARYADA